MRFEIRWKTGLDPASVAVIRACLTSGLARLAHRLGKVVLWRELRAESAGASPGAHWVLRVEILGVVDLVVSTPDPGDDPQAARHVGDRVARAVQRSLEQGWRG
ncbi:MAG: hypothetical protein IAG13_07435 [Deltaproteobacteria bacterium]|nr:hypothetical protein [Nannocystaceae bacterium]